MNRKIKTATFVIEVVLTCLNFVTVSAHKTVPRITPDGKYVSFQEYDSSGKLGISIYEIMQNGKISKIPKIDLSLPLYETDSSDESDVAFRFGEIKKTTSKIERESTAFFAWAPDSRHYVFEKYTLTGNDLHFGSIDDTETQSVRITFDEEIELDPQFAPLSFPPERKDESYFFVAFSKRGSLFIARIPKSAGSYNDKSDKVVVKQVTFDTSFSDCYPEWHPSGLGLIFSRRTLTGYDLYFLDYKKILKFIHSENENLFLEDQAECCLNLPYSDELHGVFSPKGSRIAYFSNLTHPNNRKLFNIHISWFWNPENWKRKTIGKKPAFSDLHTDEPVLTEQTIPLGPSWSPDGAFLTYIANKPNLDYPLVVCRSFNPKTKAYAKSITNNVNCAFFPCSERSKVCLLTCRKESKGLNIVADSFDVLSKSTRKTEEELYRFIESTQAFEQSFSFKLVDYHTGIPVKNAEFEFSENHSAGCFYSSLLDGYVCGLYRSPGNLIENSLLVEWKKDGKPADTSFYNLNLKSLKNSELYVFEPLYEIVQFRKEALQDASGKKLDISKENIEVEILSQKRDKKGNNLEIVELDHEQFKIAFPDSMFGKTCKLELNIEGYSLPYSNELEGNSAAINIGSRASGGIFDLRIVKKYLERDIFIVNGGVTPFGIDNWPVADAVIEIRNKFIESKTFNTGKDGRVRIKIHEANKNETKISASGFEAVNLDPAYLKNNPDMKVLLTPRNNKWIFWIRDSQGHVLHDAKVQIKMGIGRHNKMLKFSDEPHDIDFPFSYSTFCNSDKPLVFELPFPKPIPNYYSGKITIEHSACRNGEKIIDIKDIDTNLEINFICVGNPDELQGILLYLIDEDGHPVYDAGFRQTGGSTLGLKQSVSLEAGAYLIKDISSLNELEIECPDFQKKDERAVKIVRDKIYAVKLKKIAQKNSHSSKYRKIKIKTYCTLKIYEDLPRFKGLPEDFFNRKIFLPYVRLSVSYCPNKHENKNIISKFYETSKNGEIILRLPENCSDLEVSLDQTGFNHKESYFPEDNAFIEIEVKSNDCNSFIDLYGENSCLLLRELTDGKLKTLMDALEQKTEINTSVLAFAESMNLKNRSGNVTLVNKFPPFIGFSSDEIKRHFCELPFKFNFFSTIPYIIDKKMQLIKSDDKISFVELLSRLEIEGLMSKKDWREFYVLNHKLINQRGGGFYPYFRKYDIIFVPDKRQMKEFLHSESEYSVPFKIPEKKPPDFHNRNLDSETNPRLSFPQHPDEYKLKRIFKCWFGARGYDAHIRSQKRKVKKKYKEEDIIELVLDKKIIKRINEKIKPPIKSFF